MKKTAKKNDAKSPKKTVGISIEATKNEKSQKNEEQNKDTKEEKKAEEEKKPLIKFNLDFLYRREKFTLNLKNNCLVSFLKRKISEKINVDKKNLKFYYKDVELKDDSDKTNVYDMIKGDNIPFIDVKKEFPINQDIISLNSKSNLIYKVECKPILSYRDLIEKIESFCKDTCIDKNYLCEPASTNTYYACFSCSDHCFQFKRYMLNVARKEKEYKDTKFKIMEVDKSRIIEPKIDQNLEEDIEDLGKVEEMVVKDKKTNKDVKIKYRKIKHKEDDYFQKDFLNSGPNLPIEEIKEKDKKVKKKKWNI
jgi:hypothetical protein